jgi:hypothetical protein
MDAKRKIIFLDIDGVLNCFGDRWAKIDAMPAKLLNDIVAATDAKLVISSTWRGVVHSGHMDLHGFAYMLRSHGINADVVGVTTTNDEADGRGWQIRSWLAGKYDGIESWCVIDDNPDKLMRTMPLVRTDGDVGLTLEDAQTAIEILGESK